MTPIQNEAIFDPWYHGRGALIPERMHSTRKPMRRLVVEPRADGLYWHLEIAQTSSSNPASTQRRLDVASETMFGIGDPRTDETIHGLQWIHILRKLTPKEAEVAVESRAMRKLTPADGGEKHWYPNRHAFITHARDAVLREQEGEGRNTLERLGSLLSPTLGGVER